MDGDVRQRLRAGNSRTKDVSTALRWAFIAACDRVRDSRAATVATSPATGRSLASLSGHRYCVVVTYRMNGMPIPSTVWLGVADERLYFRSPAQAIKLKRISRNAGVRVAAASFRGRPLGEPHECIARILPSAEHGRAEEVIAANYGWFRRLYMFAVARNESADAYVEVVMAPTTKGT